MDFTGRVIAAFLAILLLTLFPLQYVANNIEDNLDSQIDHCTEQLSDTIRTKGYLDTHTYETFLEKLDESGELYEIEIEDIHPVTGEEVAFDNVNAVDTTNLAYKTIRNNKLDLRSETSNNLSWQLSSLSDRYFYFDNNEIQSFSTHVHTPDCFVGHNHVASGCVDGYVCHDGRLVYAEDNYYANKYVTYKCATCGKPIFQGHMSTESNYNQYTIFSIRKWGMDYTLVSIQQCRAYTNGYVEGYRQCIDTYNAMNWGGIGYDTKTIYHNYPIFNLPTAGYYDGKQLLPPVGCTLPNDNNPLCNQVVISITATNPTQTYKKGDTLITTAIATYLDGHTGIVNCTSNFNPNINGLQIVTLTYSGLVGNARTTGTRTCTISVTVINKTLSYITASPPTQTIMRYGSPSYSITAFYSDGTSSTLSSGQCTISPIDTSTYGSKTMTISYTEGGITRSTSITVYVDGIAWISVSPSEQTVRKYTEASSIPLTITANYYCSGSRVITSGYSISGYNDAMLGRQTVTVSYTEYGTTASATTTIHVLQLNRVCPICGNPYDLKPDDSDPGCPYCKGTPIDITANPDYLEIFQGDTLPITIQVKFRDGSTSTIPLSNCTSDYNPSVIGFQNITVIYAGCITTFRVLVKEKETICPICGTHYPISEGNCPVCREKVVSIIVTPEEVTVNQNEAIELTVLANHADGSAREVVDWSMDCTTSTAGVFTANVSYGGCTFPIKLTVLSLGMITCSICGLSYDAGEYPKGCPVCSETLTGIEAYLTNGSNLIQYGTTPDISVVLIFRDEHRELTETDYIIDHFDPYLMGHQTITVIYKEFSCLLEVEVVDHLATVVCPKGHVYYLNEDGSDPGCPFCVIAEGYEVVYYYDITYTYEIVEEIYKNGVYYFKQNNYLNISVTKKNISLLKKLQRFSVKTVLLGRKRRFIYGGEIS